jgi:citrate synthase
MSTKGLQDVIAATTSISDIDGERGKLWYAGYSIDDLARNATFEETVFLLHHLRLPTADELEDLDQRLIDGRDLPDFVGSLLPSLAEHASPMSMLRTTVSASSASDPDGRDGSPAANLRKSMRVIAVLPTLIAAYDRRRRGAAPFEPNPKLPHAANFLAMLTGEEPEQRAGEIFDTLFVLYADHTMNASTFTARVVASTLADLHSAVTAAIAALKGPLHGGANELAMRTLLDIGSPDRAEGYVRDLLARGEKVMGFGHRVYRTVDDPRATILREFARELAASSTEPQWYEIAELVEHVVRDEKDLRPNVDFFAGCVLYYLGVPLDLFTPMFAAARAAGWTAHIREQYADNRLIRPESEYVGPPERPWVPIEGRGEQDPESVRLGPGGP